MWQYWKKSCRHLQICNGHFTRVSESWPMGLLFLAHLSTKCSWWAIVVSQCPSSVVRRQQLLLKPTPPTPLGQLTWYLVGCIRRSGLVDQKYLKSFRSEIQDGHHGRHLENIFFASSPEPKGQLTPNLLGSIRVTCRSKIAKVVPIGNPSWLQPSWKSIFRFSWTERPIDSKLARKHQGDL